MSSPRKRGCSNLLSLMNSRNAMRWNRNAVWPLPLARFPVSLFPAPLNRLFGNVRCKNTSQYPHQISYLYQNKGNKNIIKCVYKITVISRYVNNSPVLTA
jgi:hypothetical protein